MSEHRVGIAALAALAAGSDDELLSTLGLGSCVAIVLYDPTAHVGGLAHVLLPEASGTRDQENPARVAGTAVPALIAEMTALGADASRMTARLAGGASMFSTLLPRGMPTIGARNIEAARQALAAAGIRVVAEDVGAEHGRSVYLRLADGHVEVRSLARGNRDL